MCKSPSRSLRLEIPCGECPYKILHVLPVLHGQNPPLDSPLLWVTQHVVTEPFNFTDDVEPPVLALADGKTVTLGSQSNVNVKISVADDICPKGGRCMLTSGGKFAGATVSLAAGAPDWVKGVSVVDGDIVLDVKPRGTMIIVR